ncbi:hypothetical protein [Nonomuraea typhae]|uniref:hypothetical protein n=1 Tax=Nonomuraea typhae TaxID=2603600 RepID=UPI0012FA090D|nr:hypothetical protein [Nonomuraea typhae]
MVAPKPHVNIIALVDVIGALSDRSLLNGNLSLIDDGTFESRAQGTPELCTIVTPGQVVQWTVLAVDLQTPVEIKNITFLGPGGQPIGPDDGQNGESEKLDLDIWSGVVPSYMQPGVAYRYRLEFQMYEGPYSALHVDTPSLMRV